MDKQRRAQEILRLLIQKYPVVEVPLDHTNAHELLFATMMSAQSTDKRVNIVTKDLFRRYIEIEDYASADLEELKSLIKTVGLYNNKAKNIKAAAQKIMDDYDGSVPDTLRDLITLPGVAKKTASVVLWQWFGKNEGFTVDTHVKRLAKWFGLTESDNADKVSKELEQLFPRDQWGATSLRLIFLGRELLTARNPKYLGTPWEDYLVEPRDIS